MASPPLPGSRRTTRVHRGPTRLLRRCSRRPGSEPSTTPRTCPTWPRTRQTATSRVGQFFPYIIQKDYYNQRIIPENLGNIEYDIREIDPTSNFNYTWEDLKLNAENAKVIRDGFASFFFHPFWLEPAINRPGLADFRKVMEAIDALGFQFVDASTPCPRAAKGRAAM